MHENPLLIDLYELTMADAYLANGMMEPAVFEFFVRKLPARRGFLLAAGLDQAIDYLTSLRFDDELLCMGFAFRPVLAEAHRVSAETFASPAMSTRCRKEPRSSRTSRSCA